MSPEFFEVWCLGQIAMCERVKAHSMMQVLSGYKNASETATFAVELILDGLEGEMR